MWLEHLLFGVRTAVSVDKVTFLWRKSGKRGKLAFSLWKITAAGPEAGKIIDNTGKDNEVKKKRKSVIKEP